MCRLLLTAVLLLPFVVLAESLYVTDSITVGLFDNNKLSGEPKLRLQSGEQVQVLQKKGEVAEVKTEGGDQGWLRLTFLTASTPAMLKLEQSIKELDQLERELESERETVARLEKVAKDVKDVTWMRAEMNKARSKAAELEKKLAAQSTENKQSDQQLVDLTKQLELLKADKTDLEAQLAAVLMINGGEAEVSEEGHTADTSSSWLWSLIAAIAIFIGGAAAGYYWLDRRLTRRFGGIRLH